MKPIIMAMILVTNLYAQDKPNTKKNQFFEQNYIHALWAAKETGIPISVILAISIQETGWGTSDAYNQKCNTFGFTSNGQVLEFNSRLDCYKHFISLMNTTDRYIKVRFQKHWRYSVIEIKDSGWNSEDEFWAGKVIRIILDNKLENNN